MGKMRRLIFAAAGGCLLAGLSGCATTAGNIDSAAELAGETGEPAATVVFGRFELMRNGHQVAFGDGIFASSATLNLAEAGSPQPIVGRIGRDGEFAWALEPGTHRVTSIGFRYQGQKIRPPTGFTFTVPEGYRASYVGTITLEATFDRGLLGTRVHVDRYTISDDCAAECDGRLSRLGLDANQSTRTLFSWERSVAAAE
ncbi:hypothetical protein [Lentisalinibacter salinarum]|uniref:hypothetical protein n=1 Tax=Lentisalinibacter salinarum TaxID=2992239 RepID=UPI00386A2ADD